MTKKLFSFQFLICLIHYLFCAAHPQGYNDENNASVNFDAESVDYSYGRSCIRPYRKIGPQCLFFSRPEPLWDIDVTWHGAYLNFYDAVAVCRKHGGDLAGKILDYGAALRYCQSSRGGCAPSLLWRDNKCFQWSPIDGTEAEIPCKRWEVTMRYICEMNDY